MHEASLARSAGTAVHQSVFQTMAVSLLYAYARREQLGKSPHQVQSAAHLSQESSGQAVNTCHLRCMAAPVYLPHAPQHGGVALQVVGVCGPACLWPKKLLGILWLVLGGGWGIACCCWATSVLATYLGTQKNATLLVLWHV